ncbi:MAG: ACT domain-containing protein, partial [Lachnospiraceae bacterium]|nr:ACT domain-containing protein [Lachnospiraceae bacterium]
MKKTIITVLGKDKVGIIAKVCVYLSQNNVNILDIAQTIVDGYFNMMMVVDISEASKDQARINEELVDLGKEIGVQIRA